MLVLALQFSTSGRGRAPPTNSGHRPRATATSSSFEARVPRCPGDADAPAWRPEGRVLPQNGTVMPDAAGPGGATCARERRGVGVVDGPISQRST
jgi:hypothetical protein